VDNRPGHHHTVFTNVFNRINDTALASRASPDPAGGWAAGCTRLPDQSPDHSITRRNTVTYLANLLSRSALSKKELDYH